VLSLDGEHKVGKVYKQWSGLLREMVSDADHFGITFPMDLDVKMKAVMLGACFLIVSTSILFLFVFQATRGKSSMSAFQTGLLGCSWLSRSAAGGLEIEAMLLSLNRAAILGIQIIIFNFF